MKKSKKIILGIVIILVIFLVVYISFVFGIKFGYRQVRNHYNNYLYDFTTSRSSTLFVEEKGKDIIITYTNQASFIYSIDTLTTNDEGKFVSGIIKFPVLNKTDFNKKFKKNYENIKFVVDNDGKCYAVMPRNNIPTESKTEFIKRLKNTDLGDFFKYKFVGNLSEDTEKNN